MRNFCHRVFVLCDGGSGSAAAAVVRRRLRVFIGGFLGGGDSGCAAVAVG
jgi:hypothetical protein